ncbi:excisionase [Microbacterium sp. HMWF026]|uniref:helix-turn-helix transcriptional regulator n=1 Tax=Microbacterium sp. HMWF026 TaxID=2056861 RepID=UPI000D3B4CFE|nr:helix-turn-helix domain-containing protein [Microbacterium sp. HMWF026]PTT20054.1 excisionase [Microbacterium sp. HMWF026]
MSAIGVGELLTAAEVAERLKLTVRAVNQLRYLGTGPAFVKVSHKAVRYRAADVEEWLQARVRTQTGAQS